MSTSSYFSLDYAYSLLPSTQPAVEDRQWYEGLEEYVPSLSFQQRVIGCAISILLGFILSLGSTLRIIDLMKGNPRPFAITYTIGNILALSATCFLYGPLSQAKKMFAGSRYVATIIYLLFMVLTLILAFNIKSIPLGGLLVVLSIFFQFLALSWYVLSYIPFGREIIKGCCSSLCLNRYSYFNETEEW